MAPPSSGPGAPVSVGGPGNLRSDRGLTAPPAGAARAPAPEPHRELSVAERLFVEGFAFDFFQAVRVLEKTFPEKRPVGRAGSPLSEVARFRAHISLSFPPSAIYDLARPTPEFGVPVMIVAFMGLTGPSGMLPRHYTELLIRLEKEEKGPERYALRDWFDLFNHRVISLFYRAWEKYRFYIPYERGEYARAEPDPFTLCLYSLVGMGMPPLRGRLRISAWETEDDQPRERVLGRIEDLVLLRYGGFFAHRPRCAVSLEALLHDFFQLPVQVRQFRGQWLCLEPENQSRMGDAGSNNQLGLNVVAGERVWDVQSKFRVRVGPLAWREFSEFLPDLSSSPARKAFFLLGHLIRLYVGPEFDFEVQLVLEARDVPQCRLADGDGIGARLGWNTWIRALPYPHDAEEAVFGGEDRVWVNGGPPRQL